MTTPSFTGLLREELAHAPAGERCCVRAEAAALMRLGGVIEVRGGEQPGRTYIAVVSPSGPVVRRLHRSLRRLAGVRPEVEVHAPAGLHRRVRYRLVLAAAAAPAARLCRELGVLDAAGRPSAGGPPAALTERACDPAAYTRGALMAAGSVSDPRVPAHAEVAAPGAAVAGAVEALFRRLGAGGARAQPHGAGWRVVVKSGGEIGRLLLAAGAPTAFLRWDQGRLLREMRAAANRRANADRANLSRAVAASAWHADAMARAVAALGWEGLPEELRAVALARLANPEASLAEIGGLLDPPVGKVTVHRRIVRLLRIADVPPHGG